MERPNEDEIEQLKKLFNFDFDREEKKEEVKTEYKYLKWIGKNLRTFASELPIESKEFKNESGQGKTSLFLHWQGLAKERNVRLRYITEETLINDFVINDFGERRIDSDKLETLTYPVILIIDELFNKLNWKNKTMSCELIVCSLIQFLYEFKRNHKLIVVVGTNNKIEDFISEPSIQRKYRELFIY